MLQKPVSLAMPMTTVRIVTAADDARSFRIRIIRILNLNGDAYEMRESALHHEKRKIRHRRAHAFPDTSVR